MKRFFAAVFVMAVATLGTEKAYSESLSGMAVDFTGETKFTFDMFSKQAIPNEIKEILESVKADALDRPRYNIPDKAEGTCIYKNYTIAINFMKAAAEEKTAAAMKNVWSSVYHFTNCALFQKDASPWLNNLLPALIAVERNSIRPTDPAKQLGWEPENLRKLAKFTKAPPEAYEVIAEMEKGDVKSVVNENPRKEKSKKISPENQVPALSKFCVDGICLGDAYVSFDENWISAKNLKGLNDTYPACNAGTILTMNALGTSADMLVVTGFLAWPTTTQGTHWRVGELKSVAKGDYIREQARKVFEDKLVGGLKEVIPAKPPVAPKEPAPLGQNPSSKEREAWQAADKKYQAALLDYRRAVIKHRQESFFDDADRFTAKAEALPGQPENGSVTLQVSYSKSGPESEIEVKYEISRDIVAIQKKLDAQVSCKALENEKKKAIQDKVKEAPKF